MGTTKSQTIQANLRQNRHKLTRPRQVILDVIAQAQRHLTPAEIYRKAKARYPQIGLATVYRTLDLLVELGYLQRIHLAAGCHSYASTAREHGHQLVCARCGRAEEFADCDLQPLMHMLESKTGYAIDVHMLELVGLCPQCRGHRRAQKHKAH